MPEPSLSLPLLFLGESMNVVVVIVGIGMLIFVHELGHFLVAKWNKVRVEAFSLGFGPVLWGFTRGDTHYRLSAIPLGGYVKMAGGDAPTAEYRSDDPGEFPNKPILARTAVYGAGVFMNAILGILLFILAFNVGVPLPAPLAGEILPGSPAWKAGIRAGDRIARINDRRILDFDDVYHEVALSEGPISVVVERDGREVSFPRIEPAQDPLFGVRSLGIRPALERSMAVAEDSSAWHAGLRTGDEVVTVAGRTSQQEFRRALGRTEGALPFVVRRDGETLSFEVAPRFSPEEGGRALIGISPAVRRIAAVGPGSAAEEAGFRPEDEIVRVGDRSVATLREALELVVDEAPSEAVFVVRRGESDVRIVAAPAGADAWRTFFDDLVEEASPGNEDAAVSLMPDLEFEEGNPARAAGILEGASIREINGRATRTFADVQEAIGSAPKGEPVQVKWSPPGSNEVVGPVAIVRKVRRAADYGISFRQQSATVRVPGLLAACGEGLRRSYRMGVRVVQMISGIIRGRVSAKNLGGPIAIFQLSYTAADRNFIHFLYFLGLLSINLAILNILPIPVLDGGHLLFVLIEAIRRKPLSERSMALAQWAGLLFLLLVMAYVVTQDVSRLLG